MSVSCSKKYIIIGHVVLTISQYIMTLLNPCISDSSSSRVQGDYGLEMFG